MRLDHATWQEVEAYLEHSSGVILPVGSTEQHGPVGLVGTDTLCAETIAEEAGVIANALVAPAISYTPAPSNMAFPGTISVSVQTFSALVCEVLGSLGQHGFRHVYILNAHGANLEPLRKLASKAAPDLRVRIRNWWAFNEVEEFRRALYGEWEGMHATPSEVSITLAFHRNVEKADPAPPEPPTAAFVAPHSSDRHGPPDEHRASFPDGRVGSHSGLARPEHGRRFVEMAARAAAADYATFLTK